MRFYQLDGVKQERFVSFMEEMLNSFPERFHKYTDNPVMEEIHNQYQDYIMESSRRLQTLSFWSMYIKMAGKTV